MRATRLSRSGASVLVSLRVATSIASSHAARRAGGTGAPPAFALAPCPAGAGAGAPVTTGAPAPFAAAGWSASTKSA